MGCFLEKIHELNNSKNDVSEWSRKTIADGNWLNNNTIKPLKQRDDVNSEALEFVASGMDELNANSLTVEVADFNLKFSLREENTNNEENL